MSKFKVCTKCNIKKPLNNSFFVRNSATATGFAELCKECKRIHYHKNKKTILIKQHEYDKSERCKNKRRERYYKNREEIRAKVKAYRDSNIDTIRQHKKREYNKNKEKYIKRITDRLNTDPLYRFKHRVRNLIRISFKNKYTKKSKTYNILGVDFEYLYHYLCGTFELNYGIPREYIPWNNVQIDHILPLKTAVCEEDVIRLNHYSNLQLLLSSDNREKSDKINWSIHDN